jgi:hypothetical protein
LWRLVGMMLWRMARPETLPVPPLVVPHVTMAPPMTAPRLALARLLRIVSVIGLFASVCVIGISAIAVDRLTSIRANLMTNPEGETLLQQADRLERSLDGAWWLRFYPDYPRRLAQISVEMRNGRLALIDAAVKYGECREALSSLGLPARLVRGAEITTPLAEAIANVPTQFHRETVTYLQIESEIRAYRRPEQSRTFLTGVLSSCPTGHGLLIAGLDRDGSIKWRTPDPVQSGKGFKIHLAAVATVRLTDLFRPDGAGPWKVVETVDVPFETWDDGPVPFPSAETPFQVTFAREEDAQAPKLAKLSASARAVIAPLPSALRGG